MRSTFTALAALCAAALLAGCAGTFGHAAYEVKPEAGADGKAAGCSLSVRDGKEFSGRNVAFRGDLCQLTVQEGESKAFPGQAIGAKALSIGPVMGLGDLVAPAAGGK